MNDFRDITIHRYYYTWELGIRNGYHPPKHKPRKKHRVLEWMAEKIFIRRDAT